MKLVRDNLAVSPFSYLKELISRNTYKTKTKPYFFVITFIAKHEATKVYNSGIIKRRPPTLMSSFFAMNDFYIINPASTDFLLDWIYTKRPRSSYITPFLKNIFVLACFPLDNTFKISKLLFQLKEMSSPH